MFEELGIKEINESHSLLSRVMLSKLQAKSSHNPVKSIQQEQRVLFKFKDIE